VNECEPLQSGRRKFVDPAAFARSLALETGTQQDGQEFLKLLLTFLVGRCRLTLSKLELKARLLSALETKM
jgi:hypothetical protein